jgi:hypothetical protein
VKYTETVHFKTTTEQLELIDSIASKYGKSRAATIRDMISMFVLITETDMTLRDIIIAAAPALAAQLIAKSPGTALAVMDHHEKGITEPDK